MRFRSAASVLLRISPAASSVRSGRLVYKMAQKNNKSLEHQLLRAAGSYENIKNDYLKKGYGGTNQSPGTCPKHCTTPQEVIACHMAALMFEGVYVEEGVDLAEVTVDRCMHQSKASAVARNNEENWNDIPYWIEVVRENNRVNGIASGCSEYDSDWTLVPRAKDDVNNIDYSSGGSSAFAWLKGSNQIAENIHNLHDCMGGVEANHSKCIREVLRVKAIKLSGLYPSWYDNGVGSMYILNGCKIPELPKNKSGQRVPSWAMAWTPTIPNFVRYIEEQYLQNPNAPGFPEYGGQGQFSYETLASLASGLGTPVHDYEIATGCFGPAPLQPFRMVPTNWNPNPEWTVYQNCTDDEGNFDPGVEETLMTLIWTSPRHSPGGTDGCIDAFLKLGPAVWDTTGGLRLALDQCLDAFSLCALNGYGWFPEIKANNGFTSPEWQIPNIFTIEELIQMQGVDMELLGTSCDGPAEDDTTSCVAWRFDASVEQTRPASQGA